jgi:hypothetical protein
MPRRCSIAILLVLAASRAFAQAPAQEHGRFEVGVGPIWLGAASFEEQAANETTSSGTARALFVTDTSLNSTTGIELRFGVGLTRRLDVEAVGSYARPRLVTTVRSDLEAGPGPFTASEEMQQFSVGGAVVWRLRPLQARPRWIPFVRGGLQYVRQLHEEGTLLDDGEWYEAGGGVKYLIRSREHGAMKSIGIRADVRAIVRTSGLDVDGRAHVSPALAASLFVRF